MPLFVVRKENSFYPKGTWLYLDDDGYRKVSVLRTPQGWRVQELASSVVVPQNLEINEAIFEVRADGRLDPKLADMLKETAYVR